MQETLPMLPQFYHRRTCVGNSPRTNCSCSAIMSPLKCSATSSHYKYLEGDIERERELQRVKVIENAVEGRLKVSEAAELLQLSGRQLKRLKQDYDESDAAWVHHGNQGCEPSNVIGEDLKRQVVELVKEKYAGLITAIFTRS